MLTDLLILPFGLFARFGHLRNAAIMLLFFLSINNKPHAT